MEEHPIDKRFQRGLKHHEESVPETVWERVEHLLDKETPKKKRRAIPWWPLGLAASFLLLFTWLGPDFGDKAIPPAPEAMEEQASPEERLFQPPQPSPAITPPITNTPPGKTTARRERQESREERKAIEKKSRLQALLLPDMAEDRRRDQRFILYTAVLQAPEGKQPFIDVQFASAEALLPALAEAPAEPYDEQLKSYAFSSLGNLVRGDSLLPPPAPQNNPIDRLESGWSQVVAFQKDFFNNRK